MENDPERAKAYLIGAGSNIFLSSHDYETINGFSKKLSDIKLDSKSFSGYGYYWYPTAILFDELPI